MKAVNSEIKNLSMYHEYMCWMFFKTYYKLFIWILEKENEYFQAFSLEIVLMTSPWCLHSTIAPQKRWAWGQYHNRLIHLVTTDGTQDKWPKLGQGIRNENINRFHQLYMRGQIVIFFFFLKIRSKGAFWKSHNDTWLTVA